jgi:hypothetical protein
MEPADSEVDHAYFQAAAVIVRDWQALSAIRQRVRA